ncbi:MAG: hypothetical protein GY898_11265 [Proteobacteria bacterium]|nr:hypothetical protein [Pseudomonadota bacterium]
MSEPTVVRRESFSDVEQMLTEGSSLSWVLYVLPADEVATVLDQLRPNDDVCVSEAGESLVARRIAKMIELAQLDRDPLTGLFNRRYLLARLAEWPPPASTGRCARC